MEKPFRYAYADPDLPVYEFDNAHTITFEQCPVIETKVTGNYQRVLYPTPRPQIAWPGFPPDHVMPATPIPFSHVGPPDWKKSPQIRAPDAPVPPKHKWYIGIPGGKLTIFSCCGDITDQPEAAAIASPTDSRLSLDKGVAGRVSLKAGPEMQKMCLSFIEMNGPIEPSQTYCTPAFNFFKTKYIIHVAMPTAKSPVRLCLLESAVYHCLKRATTLDIPSVALPALGSGRDYMLPITECCQTYREAIKNFSAQMPEYCQLKRIRFVFENIHDRNIFSVCLSTDPNFVPEKSFL